MAEPGGAPGVAGNLPLIWAMTTGEAGMRSQALGLAEAVGGTIVEKTIRLRPPWTLFPAHLCPAPLMGLDPAHDIPAPPWPDLLITCGRRSTAVSIAIRRASGGRTRTVHVQNPRCPLRLFDLVIAMRHDDIVGDNVLIIDTALNTVHPAGLAGGRRRWEAEFASLPRPLLAVLLGGHTGSQRFTDTDAHRLVDELARVHATAGAGVVVSPSRRTEPSALAIVAAGLAGKPWAHVWDGTGDNPYFGMLALADGFVVTNDTVSMISEAIATGKPVATFAISGESKPQARFIAALRQRGQALEFSAGFPAAIGEPIPNATVEAAARVRRLMADR